MPTPTGTIRPVLDRARADLALMARVSGGLYYCGAFLVLVSLMLPHPGETQEAPLYAISAIAALGGVGLIQFSASIRLWMIHTALACASVLVSLTIYFSGVSSGIYSMMFIWVVLVAACTTSKRGLGLQIAWLMTAYGVTLLVLDVDSSGFSNITRFFLTGFALSAAGSAIAWLVEGRRTAEAGLQREIETRKELQLELEHIANHDPLTGVANRRQLERRLRAELMGAERTGAPLCVVALDLNGFKAFNDENGHAAGDRLLKSAASAWGSVLRTGDVITRMGGDEFLAVLPDCAPDVSRRIAERLRDAVPDEQSCSTGIACWDGSDSADELIAKADAAMYRTKSPSADTVEA